MKTAGDLNPEYKFITSPGAYSSFVKWCEKANSMFIKDSALFVLLEKFPEPEVHVIS